MPHISSPPSQGMSVAPAVPLATMPPGGAVPPPPGMNINHVGLNQGNIGYQQIPGQPPMAGYPPQQGKHLFY